jgi:hypothetical protein
MPSNYATDRVLPIGVPTSVRFTAILQGVEKSQKMLITEPVATATPKPVIRRTARSSTRSDGSTVAGYG